MTPAPRPHDAPLEPTRGSERTAPAPPSDVAPKIQRSNRFYGGGGDEYAPKKSSSGSDSGRTGSASDFDRLGSQAPRDDRRPSSPAEYGRPGGSDFDRGKVSDRLQKGRDYQTPMAPPWRENTPAPTPSPEPTQSAASRARAAYMSQEEAKAVEDARKSYNGGIKLAKLAIQAHVTLGEYFPRSGEMLQRINGISYEDVLRTEHKMWKESLPFFVKASDKLGQWKGTFADDLRGRTEGNARLIEQYLKEWKDLKFKLEFSSVKIAEMVKIYREYVERKRSDALKREIEKPDGPVATG
jgi:hypothetical protein